MENGVGFLWISHLQANSGGFTGRNCSLRSSRVFIGDVVVSSIVILFQKPTMYGRGRLWLTVHPVPISRFFMIPEVVPYIHILLISEKLKHIAMWCWALVVALLASSIRITEAASLQQLNVSLANNPTNVGFYIYVPDTLAPSPPILVNPHWCHGDAPSAYVGSTFANLSSQYGFIVIYPDSPNLVDKCWDVSSFETLTHDGGGDSLGIVSMVNWTLNTYSGDPRRVFVTGVSSGAMMTNVLVGAYPDVFAGGTAFAGVALGCFGEDIATNASDVDYWNNECATGQVHHAPQEWAEIVRRAYPGYGDRWRPKMQVFHGTVDAVLNYTNLWEEIKEWTGIFGLSQTPTATMPDTPVANWTKYIYGYEDWFEAYSAWNVTHNIPVQADEVADWFDLKCKGGHCFRWGRGGPHVFKKTGQS